MPQVVAARKLVSDPKAEPSELGEVGLAEAVRRWVEGQLRPQGFALPLIKRVSLLVVGLLRAQSAKRGDLVVAIERLKVTSAQLESIGRRITRTLDDPRLDPERLLPYILSSQLPILLEDVLNEHARSSASDPQHAQHFPLLRIVVDESTKLDEVHILVAGLAYQGIVIPLAIQVWPQAQALAPEQYRAHLVGLLSSVEQLLPPVLRQHILLLADRAYGRPDFIDLIEALGWHWLLRIQGQTKIKLSDGRELAARALVNQPGETWCSGFNPDTYRSALGAFKKSGWRTCQFVAAWAPEADEPWLLITNLSATKQRFLDYASRWCVERTFLAWKSHGWDVESLQLASPLQFGRYLVAITLATIWTLACAVAHTTRVVQDLRAKRQELPQPIRQLRLPFDEPTADKRPWLAKFSLLTWGRYVLHHSASRTTTPALCWRLPDWHAPVWSIHCQQLLAANT